MDNNKKVLVTAANGNTGFPAAKELIRLGFSVRAFVRNPKKEKAQTLAQLGAELFVGNIENVEDVRKSLEGIDYAYFVPTYPNVLFQGSIFSMVANELRLKHVVVITQWLSSYSHPSFYTKQHWLVDQMFQNLDHTGVTFLNPGLFAFVYFMMPEPLLQFGMFPDFGDNAPPSNEDIGMVSAHILKSPQKHIGKTYRVTGKEVLSAGQMAKIVEQVIGRKVKANKLPEKMALKMLRAYGFPKMDASQLGYYGKDGEDGAFSFGAPSTVVRDIVGKEADDFETITKNYTINHPLLKKSLANKFKAMRMMLKGMNTRAWDMESFAKETGFPKLSNSEFVMENSVWIQERKELLKAANHKNIKVVNGIHKNL